MTAVPPTPIARWSDVLVLPENRSAVRAVRGVAKALANDRRMSFGLLVLHGSPGVGKTHLTAALLRQLAAGLSGRAVAAGDVARAAGEDDPGFADPELAACDLLVLEDVQLLPPRAAEPVCDLLDRRAAHRRPTVATANAGPAGLGRLPRKLTSRLAAGLVLRLDPPGPASRRVLLADAAGRRKLRLTDDALDWLAKQATGVRELLGFVQVLGPLAKGYPGPLDRAAVAEILAGTGQPTSNGRDLDGIVRRVAAAFGVTERELRGPSRLRRVLVPRQVAMYLARAVGGWSLPRIGAAFGRDHTTVLHAVRKVEAELLDDAALAATVDQLRRALV